MHNQDNDNYEVLEYMKPENSKAQGKNHLTFLTRSSFFFLC